jgi:hypothetical protein
VADQIPNDLVSLVRERRVIPFVGAGFSGGLGLPGWAGLLKEVADDLGIEDTDPRLDFKRLTEDASDDFLRVAEYLYLRAGSNIGPLRLSISHALAVDGPLCVSTPHVELVNIGAPQVYTTNFDDAIERTYRELGQPMEVVALPRDVAVADPHQTQIVKYHGDLRYDDTLVLTESQYWRRLDLESPMDLKFRSDLLGRSVLFMGYSFSDINIRVIWFKLMRMMEDVPESDRRPSYIVRFQPNTVLEALYKDVGLTTIVLDPESKAKTDADRTSLLGAFLSDLSAAASRNGWIPGTSKQRMFASKGLLRRIGKELDQSGGQMPWIPPSPALAILCARDIPNELRDEAFEVLKRIADAEVPSFGQTSLIIAWGMGVWGATAEVLSIALRGLLNSFSRSQILEADLPWSDLWEGSVSRERAQNLLRTVEAEIKFHEVSKSDDDDIAYAVDIAKRLAGGLTNAKSVQSEAQALVDRATGIYSAAARYRPAKDGPPNPSKLLKEVAAQAGETRS